MTVQDAYNYIIYLARYGTKKHYAFDVTMPTSDTMLHKDGNSVCCTLRYTYVYWLMQWYTQVYTQSGTLLHCYNSTL